MALRPSRIVISGGTGQIGGILARHFQERGHEITVIARYPKPASWRTLSWTGYSLGPWRDAMEGADVVINLAGRSVNCRYNATNQREILNSRTITTGLVGQAIARCANPPSLWLNASTCTIYRHSLDRDMDDLSGEIGGLVAKKGLGVPDKWAFSVEVAKSWERALFAAETPRTRRVAMRSAMVMSPDTGGIFATLLQLVRFGLGGRAGSGDQFVSWVHQTDFIRAVEFLIEHSELDGPVNICSPHPLPNRNFMRCLRQAWCTTYIGIPLPPWMLGAGAVLLRTETELILKSRRAIPTRLCRAGFDFHFPDWRGAAQDLVRRWRQMHND
jgi:uncharacterized protein (TIGR01777 family)